jgi:4-carboxymuconolactone decarboxylase
MRLNEPRIAALGPEQWNAEAEKVMAPFVSQGRVHNIFRTMANHPDLLRRWLVFANHVLGKSTLSVRDREILILRIGHRCRSAYEWGQHLQIARRAGMSDDVIAAVRDDRREQFEQREVLLLRAADELHADAFVSDATWEGLSAHYDTQQLMDIVFTVGQYTLVSMALNSFGVQLDRGLHGFDEPPGAPSGR